MVSFRSNLHQEMAHWPDFENLFHVGARQRNVDLLTLASTFELNFDAQNAKGETPMYLVVKLDDDDDGSGTECLSYLIEIGANVNLTTNAEKLPPLGYALKNKHRDQIIFLLQNNSNLPPLSIARDVDFDRLVLLADPKVFTSTTNPMKTVLDVAGFLHGCAKYDPIFSAKYREVGNDLQQIAIAMAKRYVGNNLLGSGQTKVFRGRDQNPKVSPVSLA
eukprot:m.179587 g.179587  ORF g.179587 m.179587 type:complete len:219 (+) comp39223_c1_seq2:1165-1821(+)